MEAILRVPALREQYPRWVLKEVRVLLALESVTLSAKSINRVISGLAHGSPRQRGGIVRYVLPGTRN